jgi:hypothetical protein
MIDELTFRSSLMSALLGEMLFVAAEALASLARVT